MKLDLPSRIPLPDDVRRRALDRVLDGIEEPAPRRLRPELVAAAVVVALLVGLTVALSGFRPQEPPLVAATPPGPEPSEVDIRSTEGMVSRCAAALPEVVGVPGWQVTMTQYLGGSDTVIVIDDRFACLLTPVSVSVSATSGTSMGEASVVGLGPAVVAVLNPQRRVVEVDGAESTYTSAPDAPVQLLALPGPGSSGTTVRVEGSFDGPLPDPEPPVLTVEDRTLPERPGYGSPEARDVDNDLELCVASAPVSATSRPEFWTGVVVLGSDAVPAVLVARIGDQFLGACELAPDGPRFLVVPMPPADGAPIDPDGGPVAPAVSLRFTEAGAVALRPAPQQAGSGCRDYDGLGLCGDFRTGDVTVALLTPGEDLTVPRFPGR